MQGYYTRTGSRWRLFISVCNHTCYGRGTGRPSVAPRCLLFLGRITQNRFQFEVFFESGFAPLSAVA